MGAALLDEGMSNQTLLRKADLALADLITDGGYLQPAQAQKFIRLLIKEAVMLKYATVVPMKAPKHITETIRFNGRVLRAGQEAAALPAADRAKPNLGKLELDAKLFKAEVDLDNEVLEDSIERGQLKNTIMTLMSEAISRDIDEVMIQGDTASTDTFLAQFDGIIKGATSNVVNAGTVPLSKNLFRDMIKAMPTEYLRRRSDLAFFSSIDAEIDYRDSLVNMNMAPISAEQLQGNAPIFYSGVPIVSVPMFPDSLGVGANCSVALLLDPKNIQFGVWRNIRIETDKDISAGILKIVTTLRIDSKYAYEPAVVKGINVRTS
jgi:HK97 family phage major capsid protein